MKVSKINDNNYYQVSGWMINRLRLKGVSLSVYAIIYGFTQDGDNESTASIQYFCDFCGGVSRPTVIKALKELTEKGYILRRDEVINNVTFPRYKVNLEVVKNFYGGYKETLQGGVKNTPEGGKEILHNNKDINKKLDNKKEIYKEIVDYLNEKANMSFKESSKATQQHIHARLDEGFTVDDFKTVIDKKCAEWRGTEWEQYLRPATLFGTKFESYLNAPFRNKKTVGASGVEVKQNAVDDLAGIL